MRTAADITKPPYRVPSMREIEAVPWNGYRVASTFSGCGGSCLGYRMAGFRVVWASEFIPAAQDSYRENHPDTILDTRDIREVKAEDILTANGMKVGELDLFDGSPPCQAFSTAGKRSKGWGEGKLYENGKRQCNEDLFFDYIRLLKGLQPKTFVAENVSGLVKGVAKGYFLEIFAALQAAGYRVGCRVLDAQWLGVPQSRQRTIFVGVREDLGLDPAFPKPLPYRYSVRDALPWIVRIGGITTTGWGGGKMESSDSKPASTIMAGGGAGMSKEQFGVESETDISRYAIGAEWDKLKAGEQSSKYFSCVKVDADKPCNAIMASSGSFPSAAQPLHTTERRKFTIEELKRICAFPDDFVLTGTYAQQWERCGNAVPPVMMQHIARTVATEVLDRIPK